MKSIVLGVFAAFFVSAANAQTVLEKDTVYDGQTFTGEVTGDGSNSSFRGAVFADDAVVSGARVRNASFTSLPDKQTVLGGTWTGVQGGDIEAQGALLNMQATDLQMPGLGADFSTVNGTYRTVKFSNGSLYGAQINATFEDLTAANVQFDTATISGSIANSKLRGSTFRKATLLATLSNVNINDGAFDEVSISGSWTDVSVKDSSFVGASIDGSWTNVDARDSDFRNAVFAPTTVWTNVRCRGADFSGAVNAPACVR